MSGSNSETQVIGQPIYKDRYLWIVIVLIFGVQLADSLPLRGIPALYPFIQDEFGLSRAQVGLLTSAFGISGLITGLLAGWLTDFLGVKRIITISLLIVTALISAILLAHSWPVMLVLMLLISIASSPSYPASTRVIMDRLPVRIRAFAMSLKQTGNPAGGTLAAAVLPALAIMMGWRIAASSMGILILAVAIVFFLLYNDVPRSRVPIGKLNLSTLRTALLGSGLVMPLVWHIAFSGLHAVVLSYFMLFLIEELQFSPVLAGGALAVAQFTSIATRILWGAASDFIFHRRRIVVLAITGLLTTIWLSGISLISVGVPTVVVFSLAAFIGISTLSWQGVFTALIGELAKEEYIGVIAGAAITTSRFAIMVMPPIFGYLADMNGSYSLGWKVAAGLALISTIALVTFGREPKRREF
ncbi:MFS transporter [Chloroflexota bacterium]